MRLRRLLLTVTVTAVSGTLLVPPAHAATGASGPTLPTMVKELDAAEGSTSSSQILIPEGITPTEVRGTLRLDDPTGTATILLGGTSVLAASGQSRVDVDVRVPAGSVQGGVLPLTVRYNAANSDKVCRSADDQAGLTDISVIYSGTETAPTSLAAFFPALATHVNVVVSQDAPDDELAAGLAAVGAMSHRYGAPTEVTLNGQIGSTPGTRTIVINPGQGPVTAAVSDAAGQPTLTLSGSGPALSAAAAYLGSHDPIRLLDSAQASGLSVAGPVSGSTALQQTLQTVAGTDQLVLSGYGSSQEYVGISQSAFGGAIDSLRLHLPFTYTAIPRASDAQLDVLFNNHLLWSRALGGGTGDTITADVAINANDLSRDNGLVIRLSATAAEGHCLRGPQSLPLEVHLATADATMAAERGFGVLAGLQRFPQVLGGLLPVALRGSANDRMTNAIAAATLISSMQQVAADQLNIQLVTPAGFLGGHQSGLFVGATAADADALHAPLRFVANRLLGNGHTEYQATNDQPFAALEAIASSDRDVLLLGGWAPGTPSEQLISQLTRYVGAKGWSSLSDDLLVSTLHQRPFSISSGAYVPSAAQVAEHAHFAYWLLLGIVILLAALGANYLLVRRRRDQIKAIVDAQERADATEDV